MEIALRYELEKFIPELKDSIYPTNAPETATKPYLVYARINTEIAKTLDGYTSSQALSYIFSCMATKYADMKSLTKKVEVFLLTIPKTQIGDTDKLYVQDIDIKPGAETYEHNLGVNRGIIDFTIYY